MYKFCVGQKWISDNERELGVGQIIKQDFRTITLSFPVSGEKRIYNIKSEPPLSRFFLKIGEKAVSIKGTAFFIEEVFEEKNLLHYKNKTQVISEDLLSFKHQDESDDLHIHTKIKAKDFSSNFDFCLRERANKLFSLWKSQAVKGLLAPKLRLLPHQLYLAFRATRGGTALPRLMLSDEVGLGKTIESGLIWNALQTEGKIKRTLIIVPEHLKNQWIIELGRKFNCWFTNIDENYITERNDNIRRIKLQNEEPVTAEDFVFKNVFSIYNNVLCSLEFLLKNPYVAEDALNTEWDFLIIDEAHRLIKTSQNTNAEYSLVEKLSQKIKGLLLLSGTPIQLAPEAYFYRLKLLDSARFQSYEQFEKNQIHYKRIAKDLSKISLDSDVELSWEDLQKNIPNNSPIHSWLPIKADLSLTAAEWMKRVIDALGTGSSVFRNTRKSVKGFPKRILKTYPLTGKKEWLEVGGKWLVSFLEKYKNEKILLICSSSQTVSDLFLLLNKFSEDSNIAVAFKEEESSLERDKAAALWSQPDGPNILLSSEIGSEGRNFQRAKHLVLFDLPEDSSLLEQRIGRLDRIGQGSEIYIHVPFIKKSKTEMLFLWYHEALGIFEHSLMGGGEIYAKFEKELKSYLANPEKMFEKFVQEFLQRGKKEMQLINQKAEEGRDRLLEFNSQNKKVSDYLLEEALQMDSNKEILPFAFDMLERLDVDVQKSFYPHSFVFKGAPEQSEHATLFGIQTSSYSESGEMQEYDGCSITVITNREEALNYENIEFFHFEHPVMQKLLDKALSNDFGTTACVTCNLVPTDKVFVQYNFVLEFSVNKNWGVNNLVNEHFLSRVLDNDGNLQNHILEEADKITLKNSKIQDIGIYDFEFFMEKGLEIAKKSLEETVVKITNETEKITIAALESELHTLEETYALLRDFELNKAIDKKKKELSLCKKNFKNPNLRLDAIRIFLPDNYG